MASPLSSSTRTAGLQVREVQLPQGMLLRLAALDPARYPVLFDSAAQGRVQGGRSDHASTALGTVSILAALPQAAIWQDSAGVTQTAGLPGVPRGAGFLDTLDACW